jgi:hypothetical protein
MLGWKQMQAVENEMRKKAELTIVSFSREAEDTETQHGNAVPVTGPGGTYASETS